MNRLEELMQELCPEGVAVKKLEECCTLEKGHTPIQTAFAGDYPLVVTTTERKSSNAYQFNGPTVCIPLVSSRGHGVASLNQIHYQESKFALGNILCGVTPKDCNELSARFLYYYLNYKKDVLIVPLMRGGANVSLTVDSLRTIKIPVPLLPVQCEIVRILDKFSELTVELDAELNARKEQYEFYRNLLISFSKGKIEWKPFSQCCTLSRGDYITKKSAQEGNIPVILGGQEPAYYINKSNHNGKAIVISRSGASAGFVSYWDEPIFVTDGFIIEPKNELDFRYLYFYFKNLQSDLNSMKKGGGVPHITGENIQKLRIPVPSIQEQKEISAILDRFDTLCNDISTGLPAEIEARKKQYEYYRDKLLTFKEVTDA